MTQQKSTKRRVRARMAKTGERYTAARRHLLGAAPADPATFSVSDESMQKATGRSHDEWFALLDAWDATTHSHPAIAGWLVAEHGTSGWWSQSITIDYERSRGMRTRHQRSDGFTISVTRTVNATADAALAAFSDATTRERWLEAPVVERATRARLTVSFDWAEPPSRVKVTVIPKDGDRTTVSVTHEQLPDVETAERLKIVWRGHLTALTTLLQA